MVNTAFSTKMELTREIVDKLKPARRRYFLIFNDPRLRPPVLDEMMPDLQRVIATVSKRFCDSTTPHLQFDDLTSEGNVKLAELLTKNQLERQTSRYDFFRYFKAAVNNHARSRVQKYRFTEKRTGQKPPPREQRFQASKDTDASQQEESEDAEPVEYRKNVDLSLDDPDSGLQVSDQHFETEDIEKDISWGFGPVSSDYAHNLSAMEKLVFHELISPSAHARCYAELDAMRKPVASKTNIKIKFSHMAEAIGISTALFEETVLSIRTKIKAHCMQTEQEQDKTARDNATIAQLKLALGLQIPADIDNMVVRRLLTMAARDQYDKLNDDLKEMLTAVGAKVPRLVGINKMACYGVLFLKNCRVCNSCDLRHSCAVESANIGLTDMVISPKLLGARQIRIPSFLPHAASAAEQAPIAETTSMDESEVLDHLKKTFQVSERNNQIFFFHVVGEDKKRRYLFCIERASPLRLRFCNPSNELKKELVGQEKNWCAKPDVSVPELIELIEQHGRETFE